MTSDVSRRGDVQRLIDVMASLRTPVTGCAWDLAQTHASLAPYALEEAYEVVDAIERGDRNDLREELGDLLLQVVFHARVAEEAGAFTFDDIVAGVTAKMVRRHPHVFARETKTAVSGVDKIWEAMRAKREGKGPESAVGKAAGHGLIAAMTSDGHDKAEASNAVWESIKADERKAKGSARPEGVLAGITTALPGLTRAVKLQRKAAGVGFDWGDARLVLAKIREEIDEIEAELADGAPETIADEIGDLVFAVANLARHAKVDPETAVRRTNTKFERRFAFIETELAAKGSSPKDSTLEEMDALWDAAKAAGL